MISANEHLNNLLKTSGMYNLTDDEKNQILNKGLKHFLFAKFSSKKFRKFKMDPAVIDRINFGIDSAIKQNKPIGVYFFQGGYKLWRFPSSPFPDWAEFFNIAYVISYIAPIAAAHKAGVSITYYCHTLLMEKHDNLTTQEINQYMQGLQSLFDSFSKYLPSNIKINIVKDADIYSRDEYFKALEDGITEAKKVMQTWPKAIIDDKERMANLNIKWNGREDWTKLSVGEKQQKIVLARLYEQAAGSNLPKVMERVKAPDLILLFTKSAPIFIGIGSTKTSIAKYWVGTGVLEKDENKYYERVLTPSQYETIKNQPHEIIKTKLVKGKNFSEIWVYPRLEFK
jgi:hypothetical protein